MIDNGAARCGFKTSDKMKTITTDNNNLKEVEVLYAVAIDCGHDYKEITCDLMVDGHRFSVGARTNNMPGFDAANSLDGDGRYEALYDLVEIQLEQPIRKALWELEIE